MFCSSLDGSFILPEGLAATDKSAPGCWVGEATCFRAGSSASSTREGDLGKEPRDGGVGVGCGVDYGSEETS
jgi:hypothetical protein